MSDTSTAVTRQRIAATYELIKPHVRHTPLMTIDGGDFGLPSRPVRLKLEFMQHGGSFKVRGAFANLLTRDVPQAGVVASRPCGQDGGPPTRPRHRGCRR